MTTTTIDDDDDDVRVNATRARMTRPSDLFVADGARTPTWTGSMGAWTIAGDGGGEARVDAADGRGAKTTRGGTTARGEGMDGMDGGDGRVDGGGGARARARVRVEAAAADEDAGRDGTSTTTAGGRRRRRGRERRRGERRGRMGGVPVRETKGGRCS